MATHPLILEQLVAGRRDDLGRRVEARRAVREAGRRGLAIRAVGSLAWHVGEALVQIGARLRDGRVDPTWLLCSAPSAGGEAVESLQRISLPLNRVPFAVVLGDAP